MTTQEIKRIIEQTTRELQLAEETYQKLLDNKMADPGLNFATEKQYREFKAKAAGRVSALKAKISLFSKALEKHEKVQPDINAV